MAHPNPDSSIILQFLGAADTVTGSRFLIATPHARVLVDCGLFQGIKALRLRNWESFPVDPSDLDAVLLTHAHVDHSGYLPALARGNFGGCVHATQRTGELCEILLRDSARLQEEEASYANRKGFSKHHPALPLYTVKDAENVLDRFQANPFGEFVDVAEGVSARFQPAGHILGSASITVRIDGDRNRTVFVSGDLGRPHHPLLVPPEPPPEAHAILVESTYGNRHHEDDDVVERLADTITRTAERGGTTIIPAFAVDRTELILFHLRHLMSEGRIPKLPVHVDSPMALAALGVYRRAIADGDPEIRPELHGESDPFNPGQLFEVRNVEASKELNDVTNPGIIISAAGMATGGRVLHHLARRLPDRRNSVILVGYQAMQTRGRRLLEGTSPLKMLGRYIPVRAEVVDCTTLSVHADQGEILDWLRSAAAEPETTFVVHGEPDGANTLCRLIQEDLGWSSVVARHLERVQV